MATTAGNLLRLKRDYLGSTAITIEPDATAYNAILKMAEKNVGALAVTDQRGALLGIFSERDYVRKVVIPEKQSRILVSAVMTQEQNLVKVSLGATAAECAKILDKSHIRHIPVFDGDLFVGILSIRDIVRALISERTTLLDELANLLENRT